MSKSRGRLRKFVRRWGGWVIAVLGSGLFCIWVLGGSETFQACIQGERPYEDNQSLYKGIALLERGSPGWQACVGEFLEANGEPIIAAFTILLAVSTIGLWWKTDELAQGAERSSERQLRAYVMPLPPEQEKLPEGVRITVALANTGQTPTRNNRTQCSWGRFPASGLPPGFKYLNTVSDGEEIASASQMGPQQKVRLVGNVVSGPDIVALANGDIQIMIWGWCEYDDVFGKERHRTEFAYWVDARVERTDATTADINVSCRYHWEHNGADRDCLKPIET